MLFDINSGGGLIRLGSLAICWENQDSINDYPGYTTISCGNYSLEFGELDAELGVNLIKFDGYGEIQSRRTIFNIRSV